MQINLGFFMYSFCSVVCSVILQRVLGLFLLQNLYLQLFAVSRVQDTWKCTGILWSQVDYFFQMLSVQILAHGIASPLSLHLPQEKKLWSALHTSCCYSTATQNLSQIVYIAHKIILIFNSLTDILWKKTFASCLGSWSLVLLLY